ncbi:MAG: hypothetical protein IH910_08595, partial [Proteobacteria bacterium]|nr:hypothetical protein [Pseudomonadota bacterium]
MKQTNIRKKFPRLSQGGILLAAMSAAVVLISGCSTAITAPSGVQLPGGVQIPGGGSSGGQSGESGGQSG